jgi:hypothetical protein
LQACAKGGRMIRIYSSRILEISEKELEANKIPLDIDAIQDYMNSKGGGEEDYVTHNEDFYIID